MYTNKQIWSVSYPILLSLLAQNVINVTDTAFLGHVSEVALGASAMGGLFYICIFTIAFGFSTGSQIVIARRNGEGRYSDVGPVMIQGVMFLLLIAILMFGFTKAFGGNIMRLLVSSESIYEGMLLIKHIAKHYRRSPIQYILFRIILFIIRPNSRFT